MPSLALRSAGESRIHRIEIRRIELNPHQPRSTMDEAQLRALADSIRRHGLLTPLLVRRTGNATFQLIAGERRLRALEMLGSTHADVMVFAADNLDCALLALIENMQREELHFLDQADACRRILQNHAMNREQLAAAIGLSPSALANRLRLLRLNGDVRRVIHEKGLSERHARALLRLEDETMQMDFAQRAVQKHMSVRELEQQIELQLSARNKPPCKTTRLRCDQRLVVNALKDTVRQLKRIGVAASSRVEAHDDHFDVIITIRTHPARKDAIPLPASENPRP